MFHCRPRKMEGEKAYKWSSAFAQFGPPHPPRHMASSAAARLRRRQCCSPPKCSRAAISSSAGPAQPVRIQRRQFCGHDEKLQEVALDYEVAKSAPFRSTCSCKNGWNGWFTCTGHFSGGPALYARALTHTVLFRRAGLLWSCACVLIVPTLRERPRARVTACLGACLRVRG